MTKILVFHDGMLWAEFEPLELIPEDPKMPDGAYIRYTRGLWRQKVASEKWPVPVEEEDLPKEILTLVLLLT